MLAPIRPRPIIPNCMPDKPGTSHTVTAMDARQLDRDVAGAAAAHQGLLSMLDDCLDAGTLDGAAPSRLPEWTVGHVLTHLARNADSMVRVLAAAERGATIDRYEGGVERRNAEIEEGAGRPAAELVADVRATIWAAGAGVGDAVRAGTAAAARRRVARYPVTDLPFMRWREVEVHRADLGLGYEPADWPAEYVRQDLRWMEMRWNARRPMGMTGLPQEALDAPPHAAAGVAPRPDVDRRSRAGRRVLTVASLQVGVDVLLGRLDRVGEDRAVDVDPPAPRVLLHAVLHGPAVGVVETLELVPRHEPAVVSPAPHPADRA